MKDYSQFKKCEFCGKYDMPENERVYVRNGVSRVDWSMHCDGIQTWGPDPFSEEIHGDSSDYLMCEGARRESAMDI